MSTTQPMTGGPTAATIDLRQLAPRERHARVFTSFDALPAGQSLLVLTEHDARPLRAQLAERCAGQFAWATLEAGPEVWRVQITRTGVGPRRVAGDSCCSGGACC